MTIIKVFGSARFETVFFSLCLINQLFDKIMFKRSTADNALADKSTQQSEVHILTAVAF